MDKNKTLPYEALSKGYILIPKFLMEEQLLFNRMDKECNYFTAFLTILTKVNYKESMVSLKRGETICGRGESLRSTESWAKLFNWTRGKTRRFLENMERRKLIEVTATEQGVNRTRVVDYDLWTNKPGEEWEKRKTNSELMFERFWEEYHEVTMTAKREIGAARREWKDSPQRSAHWHTRISIFTTWGWRIHVSLSGPGIT